MFDLRVIPRVIIREFPRAVALCSSRFRELYRIITDFSFQLQSNLFSSLCFLRVVQRVILRVILREFQRAVALYGFRFRELYQVFTECSFQLQSHFF